MNLNGNQRAFPVRDQLRTIEMCGFLILVNNRDGKIGLDEIRNLLDLLSRHSLETNFSMFLKEMNNRHIPSLM